MDVHHQPVGIGKREDRHLPDVRKVQHHPGRAGLGNAEAGSAGGGEPSMGNARLSSSSSGVEPWRSKNTRSGFVSRPSVCGVGPLRSITTRVCESPTQWRMFRTVVGGSAGSGLTGAGCLPAPADGSPVGAGGSATLTGRSAVRSGAGSGGSRIAAAIRVSAARAARSFSRSNARPRRGLVVEPAGIEAHLLVERLRRPAARRIPTGQQRPRVGGPDRQAAVVEALGGVAVDPSRVVERVVAIAAAGIGKNHGPVFPADALPPVLVAHRARRSPERLLRPPRCFVELFGGLQGAPGARAPGRRGAGSRTGHRHPGAQEQDEAHPGKAGGAGRGDHGQLRRGERPERRAAWRRGRGRPHPGVRVRRRCAALADSRGPSRSAAWKWMPSAPG